MSLPAYRSERYPVLLAAGDASGRSWRFELEGTHVEAADRRFLPIGAARPLLTGYAWTLQLDLSPPVRAPALSPYDVVISLVPRARAEPVREEYRRHFPGQLKVRERRLLWELVRPDRSTQDRLAATLLDTSGTGTRFLNLGYRTVEVPPGSHLVTEWRPRWRPFLLREGGVLIELDERMHVVSLGSVPRTAGTSSSDPSVREPAWRLDPRIGLPSVG